MSNETFDSVFRSEVGDSRLIIPSYRRNIDVKKTYAVIMTPRSGSTWLTHEVASYDVLSCPDEYFNINGMALSLKSNPCNSIVEYYDIVNTKMMSDRGIFGFEISYFDLEKLEKEVSLLTLMRGERYFINLTRKNFVAQAVSLFIAVETGLYHRFENSADQNNTSSLPAYDKDKILHWSVHILQQEFGIRKWIADHGVSTLEVTYESMKVDIDAVVANIAMHIHYTDLLPQKRLGANATIKLAHSISSDYEMRFRSDFPSWCDEWQIHRGAKNCFLP